MKKCNRMTSNASFFPRPLAISCFTLSERRIQLLREDYGSAGPKIMAWDGRDQHGDAIANGVYLYVLRGRRHDDREHEIKQTGRLVIMK
jgi:hypothetical protein